MKKPVGTLFDYCLSLYAAMEKESEKEKIGGKTLRVFSGHATRIMHKARVPVSYYSNVFEVLSLTGAAVQIQRGGGSNGVTKIALCGEPTQEDFDKAIKLMYREEKPGDSIVTNLIRRREREVHALKRLAGAK
jgi:hypothetical protein